MPNDRKQDGATTAQTSDTASAAARPRRLAGIRADVALEDATAYHAVAREAALDAFARAYERNPVAPTPPALGQDDEPEYGVGAAADGELLVIAGVWPGSGRTCGRLVAPRD